MTDIKLMVDAARQLNQTWKTCSNGLEMDNVPNDVYNALCEVDEAVTNLIDKIGEATKIINSLILSELNLVFLTKIKCGIFAYITFFLYLCI